MNWIQSVIFQTHTRGSQEHRYENPHVAWSPHVRNDFAERWGSRSKRSTLECLWCFADIHYNLLMSSEIIFTYHKCRNVFTYFPNIRMNTECVSQKYQISVKFSSMKALSCPCLLSAGCLNAEFSSHNEDNEVERFITQGNSLRSNSLYCHLMGSFVKDIIQWSKAIANLLRRRPTGYKSLLHLVGPERLVVSRVRMCLNPR